MAEIKVGGEVDSFCTRCKMTLAHTVLAVWAGQIKRVRCNTCMGEHAFRSPGGSSASTSAAAPRAARPAARAKTPAASARPAERVSGTYEELMAGKSRASARRFNLKDRYALGDLIEHPTFGIGVVAAVRGADKIDVAFPMTVRTLQHNRGATPVPLARPLPARVPDVVVEDESDPTEETSDEVAVAPSVARR